MNKLILAVLFCTCSISVIAGEKTPDIAEGAEKTKQETEVSKDSGDTEKQKKKSPQPCGEDGRNDKFSSLLSNVIGVKQLFMEISLEAVKRREIPVVEHVENLLAYERSKRRLNAYCSYKEKQSWHSLFKGKLADALFVKQQVEDLSLYIKSEEQEMVIGQGNFYILQALRSKKVALENDLKYRKLDILSVIQASGAVVTWEEMQSLFDRDEFPF